MSSSTTPEIFRNRPALRKIGEREFESEDGRWMLRRYVDGWRVYDRADHGNCIRRHLEYLTDAGNFIGDLIARGE